MLKMLHPKAQSGGTPDFWNEAWSDGAFEEALRFCDVDPLRPLFLEHARPGLLMLEGGCGRGQYVAYYSALGVRVVGLDFEREALHELRTRHRDLLLCTGDVSRLPFRDETVDVYYSGGVVEHFEGGPDASLREAHRVLRPGGLFLVSVPYFSPLRRLKAWFAPRDWRRRPRAQSEEHETGWTFFQYAFTPREFRAELARAGFDVVSTQGYAVLWGLRELPGMAPLFDRVLNARRGGTASSAPGEGRAASAVRSGPRVSLLKRLVVSEDATVPVAGSFVRLLRWAAANMMMYVCVARRSPQPRP